MRSNPMLTLLWTNSVAERAMTLDLRASMHISGGAAFLRSAVASVP